MVIDPKTKLSTRKLVLSLAALGLFTFTSCSVAETKAVDASSIAKQKAIAVAADPEKKADPIQIDPSGPADTVRSFYRDLKEKKFREAIFLTNLRPAIEGLTDSELKDFALDFESLAGQVPAQFEINGEIVSGDRATVTAKLPTADGDKTEVQPIKLRRERSSWIILTVDEEAESRILKEGKQ